MNATKPLILVTNDDGIMAPGIRTLIELMNEIGDVVVVAPDSPQSGMSHAITISNMLHCDEITIDSKATHKEYSCSGTPVDCVKIASRELLDRKPDLCVSGINHGSNAAINVVYSGTMSAAIEAGIEGIPAIGFSLLDYGMDANFEASRKFITKIVKGVLKNGLSKGIVLNVNIPNIAEKKIKGIKVCRQAKSYWLEDFDKRTNPLGREYYWLSGTFINEDTGEDTDIWALENGYVSIVPTQFDLTAHKSIDELNKWQLND